MADPKQSARADDDIALGNLAEQTTTQSSDSEDPELVLASFRKEWRRELENQVVSSSPGTPNRGYPHGHPRPLRANQTQEDRSDTIHEEESITNSINQQNEEIRPDIELKATELFNKAVELEQSSQLYEAIQFYRRAMTLVPDIEFRVHQHSLLERNEGYHGTVVETEESHAEEELAEEHQDLVPRFQTLMTSSQAMCIPQYDQEAPHISCLPPEMLHRILCWVVGTDLDMRSLEQVSQVCQGFYLLARNAEIWRKACLRVWGITCGLPGAFGSWREMFIQRPHPRYNGCYISRTSYFRQGDCSFQDQNCQPWHLVYYYRYIRFFTDGTACMLTTPEEPGNVVGHLRIQECRFTQAVRGHYRIQGSNVIVYLKNVSREKVSNRRKGRRQYVGTTDVAETLFKIEFEIRAAKGKPRWLLAWRSYTICYVKFDSKQNFTDVDVNDSSKFPSLAFSRVKSYSTMSEMPLT